MARKKTDMRVTATLDADLCDKLAYIAEKREQSLSETLRDAVRLLIQYECEDYYPLAKLEAARINQFAEQLVNLTDRVSRLESVCIEGFESITNLAHGDYNYLHDDAADEGVFL